MVCSIVETENVLNGDKASCLLLYAYCTTVLHLYMIHVLYSKNTVDFLCKIQIIDRRTNRWWPS